MLWCHVELYGVALAGASVRMWIGGSGETEMSPGRGHGIRPPALVISGHTMALAVVRALGEADVPVVVLHYDRRDVAHRSRYVAAHITVPDPLHEEARFVDALLAQARVFAGAIVIPASDESVVAVSRNLDTLSEHVVVACTPWDVTERFIDKSVTYAIAAEHGIPAPRTLVPRSRGELDALGADIGYPLVLKPAESHRFYEVFHRKMVWVESPTALRAAYDAATAAGLRVMVQEYIPGDDGSVVNYNAYVADGRPVAEFTARQLRKAPPRFGSPRVVRGERIPEVIDPGRAILAAIGFSGFACTEFKRDARDGTYRLMEVNGRHNLSGILAVRSGANFPLIQYRHLVEGVLPEVSASRYGLYWTDAFRDVGYSLAGVRAERWPLREYVRPYASPHCDAILDWHDAGPALARLRYVIGHVGGLAKTAARR